jgi:hypothetical protein
MTRAIRVPGCVSGEYPFRARGHRLVLVLVLVLVQMTAPAG